MNIVGGKLKTKKVKLKLKQGVIKKLKIIGVILGILLVAYMFYCKQLSQFTELGYSREASKKILFSEHKEYILTVKENKTLNAAFESENFKDKYLKNYAKISFVEHKSLIKNINKLLEKGYSNSDVSIILTHGSEEDVISFTERERVRYLEEFLNFPYAKIKYYDRYIAYTDETGEDEKTTVIHVNLNMDKKEYEDAVTEDVFSYDMLVNKFHYLEEDFIPNDLVEVSEDYRGGTEAVLANRTAVNAVIQMIESARIDGLELVVNSSYRSHADQVEIAEFYRKWYGDNYVENYIAKPGYSEHQTGLAFDMGSKKSKTFAESKEYEWIVENAHKYGFIARFTKRGQSITGYRSEPAHFRYVGKEIAEYIYKNKITFEEYYVMFLDK